MRMEVWKPCMQMPPADVACETITFLERQTPEKHLKKQPFVVSWTSSIFHPCKSTLRIKMRQKSCEAMSFVVELAKKKQCSHKAGTNQSHLPAAPTKCCDMGSHVDRLHLVFILTLPFLQRITNVEEGFPELRTKLLKNNSCTADHKGFLCNGNLCSRNPLGTFFAIKEQPHPSPEPWST